MAVEIKQREIPSNIKHNLDNIHPLLQNIYLSRGITESKFLEKDLKNLYSYDLLLNIDKAVELIYKHILNKNKILIIGDFDGDGATSTALAVDFFRQLGVSISFLVPDRFTYGYGLSVDLVDLAKQKFNPDLIITVDSGISCLNGVARAKELGFDILVTDHHLPGDNLPVADCIVNPNLKEDSFPSKNLAGVGVIFYVLLALRAKLRDENWFASQNKNIINMAQFLDLVALGTITDLVPLDYNNRILVMQGLTRIRQNMARVGIKALLKISKKNHTNITASDLGFFIGPRLNAAGRLDDMSLGINCLLSNDPMQALRMAESLDSLNQERKLIEKDMKADAISIIKKLDLDNKSLPVAFCLYNPDWHQGVIGIVASRIKELYHRPVVVFTEDNDEIIKASCRSVENVHIRDVLQSVANQQPDLIIKFGGHAMAAGLSIKKSNFDEFKQLFTSEVNKFLDIENIKGVYHTDGSLEHSDFNLNLVTLIKNSEVWGQQFPEPSFCNEFKVLDQRYLAGSHIAFKLNYNNLISVDAIIFNCQENPWFNKNLNFIKVIYKLDINEYNNNKKIQLLIDYLEEI